MANLQISPDTFQIQLQSSPDQSIQILCSEHASEFVTAHREDFIAKEYSDLVTQVRISAYQVIPSLRRSAPKVLQQALIPLSEGGPYFVCRVPYAKESWRCRIFRAGTTGFSILTLKLAGFLTIISDASSQGKKIRTEATCSPKFRIRLFFFLVLLVLLVLLVINQLHHYTILFQRLVSTREGLTNK